MSIDAGRKAKRGRPPVESEQVSTRIAQPLLGQLDTWIDAQPEPRPTRPEAVRIALREWLAGREPETPVTIAAHIEALETELASIPPSQEHSAEAALGSMDRAIAENELVALKRKRKRLRKPRPRTKGTD